MNPRAPRALIQRTLMDAYERRTPAQFSLICDGASVCSFALTPVLDGNGAWSWATWMPLLGNTQAIDCPNGSAIVTHVAGIVRRLREAFVEQMGMTDLTLRVNVGDMTDFKTDKIEAVTIRPKRATMGLRSVVDSMARAELELSRMMPNTLHDARQNQVMLDIAIADQMSPITVPIFLEKRAGIAPGYTRRYVLATVLHERHQAVFGGEHINAERIHAISRLIFALTGR